MEKYVLFFCLYLWCAGGFAQTAPDLFLPLSWEQASAVAARENKLVLVEVGDAGDEACGAVRRDRELGECLRRQTVAIRMDMDTPQGKAFESRLLLYPYPAYAFFMPYGDLVGIVMPEEVRAKPGRLRAAVEEAKEAAQVKKRNSRSVRFVEEGLVEASARAGEAKRILFVYVADDSKQASRLMEKNVFTLDRVADFYNSRFHNVRLGVREAAPWTERFGVKEAPAFLFLNGEGKLLWQAEGYGDAEQMLAHGAEALERAKGIPFEVLTDGQAQEKAKKEGKFIFVDCYAEGRGHRALAEEVFADPELAEFFRKHFVNVAREGRQTVLLFGDGDGREVHRVMQAGDAEELLEEAERALEGRGTVGMAARYEAGERGDGFVEEYMAVLVRAGMEGEASRVAAEYFAPHAPEVLKEKSYWTLFNRYVRTASPALLDYLLSHRAELAALHGDEEVHEKLTALCMAAAEGFVQDGRFDEEGFKGYARRLKKEKVPDWRRIVRDARMRIAEQVGDWKTYTNLAEEKWNEERIEDAELYRWAQRIEAQCRDGNVRYKMAQWLARRVTEINRKEHLTGKVDLTSYRGFFEKLADDLLKELE